MTGGVSTWVHQYMKAMPQHEFVVWAVGADSKDQGKFKYELPDNVVEIREIFLNDALTMPFVKEKYKFKEEELEALREFVNCREPDWETLFRMYHDNKVSPVAFCMSEDFLEIPYENTVMKSTLTTSFRIFSIQSDLCFFRCSIFCQSDVPNGGVFITPLPQVTAECSRGLGSYVNGVPYEITEHGIYTREREEEIIRDKSGLYRLFKRFLGAFFSICCQARHMARLL